MSGSQTLKKEEMVQKDPFVLVKNFSTAEK
jgi:hypothetical protein